MARSYTTVPEHQLGNGIDQRSSENLIAPGFAEDILNGDTLESRILKRVGYQGVAGNIPVRVLSIEYDHLLGETILELDDSIDLLSVPSSPLVIYGRSSILPSSAGGDWSLDGDTLAYYPGFQVDPRKPISGTGTIVVSSDESGMTSSDFFVGVVASTSDIDFSHETFLADSVEIDVGTLDTTIGYTEADPNTTDALIYFLQKDSSTGTVYHLDYNGVGTYDGAVVSVASDVRTVYIPATSHNLNNLNIIPEFYAISGTTKKRTLPDSCVVDNDTGAVTITFDGDAILESEMHIILSAAPATNIISGQTTLGSTETVRLVVADSTQKFPFVASYVQVQTGSTNESHLVLPDSIVYDDSIADTDGTRDLEISFTNDIASSSSFEVYYEFGSIISNKITLDTPSLVSSGTDTRPQLTIWGLDHTEIYGGINDERQGWATHIDSYRRSAERRMVTGLGGNLYDARTYAESGVQYGYQSLYPRARSRVSGEVSLAPLFSEGAQTRTQGYLETSTGTSLGPWLEVDSIAWQSGTGRVRYTLKAPGLTEVGGVVAGMYTAGIDELTTNNCGVPRHNGTFRVQSISLGTDVVYVDVDNSEVDAADWDETFVNGRAGIFSDFIPLALGTASNPFQVDDTLLSGSLDETDILTTLVPTSAGIHISGIVDAKVLASNLRLSASRTDSIVPLRNLSGLVSTADGYVRGDMVSYTGAADRLLRVEYVTPHADRNITLDILSGVGTVTITAGDAASFLSAGQRVSFSEMGTLSGSWSISKILDTSSYEVDMTGEDDTTTTLSGIQIGYSIQVDETLSWEDAIDNSNIVQVEERWIPIEAPDDNFDLTPSTYIHHFDSDDYVRQSYLRSAMSNNNLYFTNGNDEVMKFDGTSIYRAGLFRWQPGLFVTVDETATGKIVIPQITIDLATASPSTTATNVFSVENGKGQSFSEGANIIHTQGDTTSKYTISGITSPSDPTLTDSIYVTSTITGSASSGTISETTTYTYYFRLNAIDINSNQVASAVTGAEDFVVELGQDAAVELKLVGMPAWDIYDYDNIEVEIYRTTSNSPAPFYKIATIPLGFDNGDGYITYTDTAPDEILTTLDSVNSVLLGAEIGTSWTEPMRAKYITSAGNRLVLGNLTDYPQMNIQIEDITSNTLSNFYGSKWTLRRDFTDTATDTNMVDRATYEMVEALGANTQTLFFGINHGVDSLVVNTPSTNFAVRDWIYLFHTDDREVGPVTFTNVVGDLTVEHFFSVVSDGDLVSFSGTGLPTGVVADKTYELVEENPGISAKIRDIDTGALLTWVDNGTGSSTMTYRGPRSLEESGWFQIYEIPNANQITVRALGNTTSVGTLAEPNRIAWATDRKDIPVVLGDDGNRGTKFGNSILSPKTQVASRLGEAINASMRVVDVEIPTQESFRPWAIAGSGGEFAAGQIVIRQPRVDINSMEILLPATFSNYRVAVNGTFRSEGSQAGVVETVYPSRVVQSYANFPEIFDNQRAIVQSDSDSIIDVNTSDGQELTGLIPFFGSSVTSAAQLEGIVLVAKENSIYVYNTENRTIQKLETQGLGCTAPYSLASSRNGINFANEAGIYQIDRTMRMQFLGRYIDRIWQESVDRDYLENMQGHTFALGKQYKLSTPVSGSHIPSEVLVYDYAQEEQGGDGSWVRYDNHPATGWANLDQDAYFSSSTGRVFSIRRSGTDTDYRDDSSPVAMDIRLRSMDFGDAGIRKNCVAILTHLRAGSATAGTKLLVSRDLSTDFEETTGLVVDHISTGGSGIGDPANRAVITLRSATNRSTFLYIQVRYTNSSMDEPVEIVGVDFRVSGMSRKGTVEAADK